MTQIVPYSRRWAVAHSPFPEDALIYDTCITVLIAVYGRNAFEAAATPSARHDRYVRDGEENIQNSFALPVTIQDAAVILHRFARRYTNGRGTTTAAVVNEVAETLQQLRIDLTGTKELDGTIWAADGSNGDYDGLTPEQRNEALSVVGRLPGQSTKGNHND